MIKSLVELSLRDIPKKSDSEIFEAWLKANSNAISMFEMIYWQRVGDYIQRGEALDKRERSSRSFMALSTSSNPRTK